MTNKIALGISGTMIVILGTFLAVTVYAQSATIQGSTSVGRIDYVEAADQELVCTSGAEEFQGIPGMTKTFTQGGFLSNEVVVTLSGQFIQTNNPGTIVRFLIDGVPQPGLGQGFNMTPNPATIESKDLAFSFVSVPLSPGAHTAVLQWRGETAGASGCFQNWSIVINQR